MPEKKILVGGSFAPPLTDKKLTRYAALAASASPQIAEAMQTLLKMCKAWWELPESTGPGKPHPTGRCNVLPLEQAYVEALDPHVPWKDELDMFAKLFDGIDAATQKELRDAAFHLLWHGYELFNDREPCTTDKL